MANKRKQPEKEAVEVLRVPLSSRQLQQLWLLLCMHMQGSNSAAERKVDAPMAAAAMVQGSVAMGEAAGGGTGGRNERDMMSSPVRVCALSGEAAALAHFSR